MDWSKYYEECAPDKQFSLWPLPQIGNMDWSKYYEEYAPDKQFSLWTLPQIHRIPLTHPMTMMVTVTWMQNYVYMVQYTVCDMTGKQERKKERKKERKSERKKRREKEQKNEREEERKEERTEQKKENGGRKEKRRRKKKEEKRPTVHQLWTDTACVNATIMFSLDSRVCSWLIGHIYYDTGSPDQLRPSSSSCLLLNKQVLLTD